MSFLDWLLANDKTGELRAIVERDKADLAAGITWGVYDGDELVDTAPADALNRDPSSYEIKPTTGGDQ